MSEIAVSVIIPIYNAEKYIGRCLDSLFSQSFEGPFEVIASLNGCTDNTYNIVEEYSKKHNNLIIINDKNKLGAATSRVNGINIARGEYLCFIDADDYYHKDYIKRMYEEVTKGYDMVCSSYSQIIKGKIRKNSFISNKELNRYGAVKAQLHDIYLRSFMVNKMYKRSLYTDKKIYYPKKVGVLFEDTVTVFQLVNRVESFKFIKDSLYYYDKDVEGSGTNNVNKARFDQHLCAFALIRYLIDQENDPKLFKIFRHTFWRSYWSLWYDAHFLRKEFHHSAFKHLKLHKRELKLLKNKKPLPVKGEVWEQYFNDCLS